MTERDRVTEHDDAARPSDQPQVQPESAEQQFERVMESARKVMQERREALRELAKY